MAAKARNFRVFSILLAVLGAILLSSCAIVTPQLEQPTVKLNSLALAEGNGFSQTFNVGLLLTNPNGVDLNVTGMSYSVSLNGEKIITGVSSDIPGLKAYADTPVMLSATADIFSAARLVKSLASVQDNINYELTAKLELGGWRLPIIIKRSGVVELGQSSKSI